MHYLKETLDELSAFNGGKKCLVPIHADGDGHCLVHAISRCLVGRELFWHALRTNMQVLIMEATHLFITIIIIYLFRAVVLKKYPVLTPNFY